MEYRDPKHERAARLTHAKGPWQWPIDWPCPIALAVNGRLFVSGQMPLDKSGFILAPGDIGAQTRRVFENMRDTLAVYGLSLSDLVRLNTYYVYDGPEDQATAYWEEMTRVRLEFLPDPGPAATAVRVAGLPLDGCMIQIEGVAHFPEQVQDKQRIMPIDSWDWSIPVPLSQGWRVGNTIYVGGQISADKKGHAVADGDIDRQTDIVLDFIDRVVEVGGGNRSDIATLKVCYGASGSQEAGRALLERILERIKARMADTAIALTAFAVDLLYEGLLLEIDALAERGRDGSGIAGTAVPAGFPPSACGAVLTGDTVHIGGRMAIDAKGAILHPGDLESQLRETISGIDELLNAGGTHRHRLAKINLFYVGHRDAVTLKRLLVTIAGVLADNFGTEAPAITVVRVDGLPVEGAMVQVDGVAVIANGS